MLQKIWAWVETYLNNYRNRAKIPAYGFFVLILSTSKTAIVTGLSASGLSWPSLWGQASSMGNPKNSWQIPCVMVGFMNIFTCAAWSYRVKPIFCSITYQRHLRILKQRIIYIDANTPDNNDSSSWTKAYKYLQDTLADANSSGDVKDWEIILGFTGQ